MVTLCAEQRQSVLWIDPYGRQFTRESLALLVFSGAPDWETRFREATDPICVRALRSRSETLTLEEAFALADRRMKRIAARPQSKPKRRPLGPLIIEE